MRSVLAVWFALLVAWPGAAMAQGLTGFLSPGPLAEPHAHLDSLTQCSACHEAGKGVTAARCLACHDLIRSEVESKKGFHADKGASCHGCHPDHRGRAFEMVKLVEAAFDHTPTGFPLRGGHATLACKACHSGPDYHGLDQACASCHDDPHGSAQSTRALAQGCEACHTDAGWDPNPLPPRVFDHGDPAHAAWKLDGAHAKAECSGCHPQAKFLPTAHQACTTCHDDPHGEAFSNVCTSCHNTSSWRVKNFDHTTTGFQLEGLHAGLACSACHGRDLHAPFDHATCASCHDDPHRAQFAPRTCDTCHTVDAAAFKIAAFDHAIWPLLGEHGAVACHECHGTGPPATYVGTTRTCEGCHDDPHDGRFAPTPCETCHSPVGWRVEDFDHSRTDFPLTGKHAPLGCDACHTEPHVFSGLAHGSCADCHADHPHGDALTAPACSDCHTTDAFLPTTFDHATTAFALAPAHTEAACTDCHTVTVFAGLEPACETCHEPDRPTGHFQGSCGACHQGAHWLPAGFGDAGHEVTGFPLHGTHERLACESCHPTDGIRSVPGTACVSCHATDDIHRNRLGQVCSDCHRETSWVATRFRHQLTGWPLRGAHRLAACDDCHAVTYAGTPSDCATCHRGQAPMSVLAHASPWFNDCEACHKPYTWDALGMPH